MAGRVTVTRDQQEDLDPVLGRAFLAGGAEFGDMIMEAYKIGRRHGAGPAVYSGCPGIDQEEDEDMAIATGGDRSIRFEGGVWFWEQRGEVMFSISDPELPGHSTIGIVHKDSAAEKEIHSLLVKMKRKVD